MTLEQLRIFVAVAEREHMTRAAESLGVTQSAASASIAALESRYGTKLFHRVGRNIELTDAGRLLQREAKAVLGRVTSAELALNELRGLKRGILLVHASQTIASYWLPAYLVSFHERYPEVELRLGIGNTWQVAEAVRTGSAEIGFVEGPTESTGQLSDRPMRGDRLAVVVGKSHPWAHRKKIRPADLLRAEWILRERGSGTRSEFEAALKNLGISPTKLKIAFELPSNEAIRAAVEAGAGATAVSELVVESPLRLGTLSRVPLELPSRQFHILSHRERYLSEAAKSFLEMVSHAARPTQDGY